jgi:hypothetical protein
MRNRSRIMRMPPRIIFNRGPERPVRRAAPTSRAEVPCLRREPQLEIAPRV